MWAAVAGGRDLGPAEQRKKGMGEGSGPHEGSIKTPGAWRSFHTGLLTRIRAGVRCWCATQVKVTILYLVSLFAINSTAATVKVISRYNSKKLIS